MKIVLFLNRCLRCIAENWGGGWFRKSFSKGVKMYTKLAHLCLGNLLSENYAQLFAASAFALLVDCLWSPHSFVNYQQSLQSFVTSEYAKPRVF